MHSKQQSWNLCSRPSSPAAKATLAMVIVLALTVVSAPSVQAQTEPYEAIHAFTLGQHGATPFAGLASDKAENLYGAAVLTGNGGLSPKGSNVTVLRNLASDPGIAMSTTDLSRTNGSGPVTYGQEVDILATVTGDGSSGTPTGTVAFTVNGNLFDTNCDSVPLTMVDDNTATAPCPTALLPAGNPTTITGEYNGDGTLQTAVHYPVGVGPESLVAIDPNQSGHADLITANGNSGLSPKGSDVTVLRNLKAGNGTHPDTISVANTSGNPTSTYGDSVTFTATLTGEDSGTPFTGTVAFTDNGVPFDSQCNSVVPIVTNDPNVYTATCMTVLLPAGQGSLIVATLSGDPYYVDHSSPPIIQNVNKATPVFSAIQSNNPNATLGQPIIFTATLTGVAGYPQPTGNVVFTDTYDGIPTVICTSPLTQNGTANSTATCSTPPPQLLAGSHSIVATYSPNGDPNYGPASPSPPRVQPVGKATPVFSPLTSNNPNATYGQPITFTATLTGVAGYPQPTGTVTFASDGGPIPECPNPVPLNNGQATCTTSSLPAGWHTIRASYSGDQNYDPSFGVVTQVVIEANTTTTVTSSQDPSTYGQQVTFTATVTGIWITPTGEVTFGSDGGPIPECPSPVTLINGVATCSTSSLPPGDHTIQASYSGDSNYLPSSGMMMQEVTKANTTTTVTSSQNPSNFGQPVTFTATVTGIWIFPTGTVTFASDGGPIPECPNPVPLNNGQATCTTSSLPAGEHTIEARYFGDSNYNASSGPLSQIVNPGPSPVQFVPVTPCRLVDTRPQHGGSGPIQGGTFQSFPIPQEGGCNLPTNAAAYSLNVTVVPHGPLGYLTIWPTGEYQPVVSTMNSVDGRVKADAAIVPAGSSGEVSVYVTNTTDVILDIDGYFAPVSSSTLAFYPLPPCRVVDTRRDTFPPGLGPPSLSALTPRDLPVLLSPCIPSGVNPAAYSFNFTVVPGGHPVGYLSAWPTGQSQPVVSTLNDQTGTIVANAAIVPAGTGGDISVYSTHDTQLLIDINGYFALVGPGGLSLYPVAPCRVIDTRHVGSGQPFSGTLTPPVDVVASPCGVPSTAQAYVFNATVVPSGFLGYLTLWPDGQSQPVVSTLNAVDGAITSNMAIVPAGNQGKVDAFANGLTQLILDISSYFAP